MYVISLHILIYENRPVYGFVLLNNVFMLRGVRPHWTLDDDSAIVHKNTFSQADSLKQVQLAPL